MSSYLVRATTSRCVVQRIISGSHACPTRRWRLPRCKRLCLIVARKITLDMIAIDVGVSVLFFDVLTLVQADKPSPLLTFTRLEANARQERAALLHLPSLVASAVGRDWTVDCGSGTAASSCGKKGRVASQGDALVPSSWIPRGYVADKETSSAIRLALGAVLVGGPKPTTCGHTVCASCACPVMLETEMQAKNRGRSVHLPCCTSPACQGLRVM